MDEIHFHLYKVVNTDNCHILGCRKPHQCLKLPLHSSYETVWCGFTATCILGPLFSKSSAPNVLWYAFYRSSILIVIGAIRDYRSYGKAISFKNSVYAGGATPHITHCAKRVLRRFISDDAIICHHLPTVWPLDLNPCDFWLWEYLKDMVYRDPITSVSDLKNSLERYVGNIPLHTLLSTVEHAILLFQMVAENDEHYI